MYCVYYAQSKNGPLSLSLLAFLALFITNISFKGVVGGGGKVQCCALTTVDTVYLYMR